MVKAIAGMRFVTSSEARVEYAPWGKHWWLSDPELTATRQLTLVRVRMRPGGGTLAVYEAPTGPGVRTDGFREAR